MEKLLRLFNAQGGQRGGFRLFVHHIPGVRVHGVLLFLLVVHLYDNLLFQAGDKHLRHIVKLGGFLPLSGNNEGGPGFVDEDGVHLVHDGKGVSPLDQFLLVNAHVVPQIVKAHFVVGAVGDVGGVGFLAFLCREAVDNQPYFQPQKAVDLAHPLAVTPGQIVVDRDNMHALSGQRVQIRGKRGDKRFAFTGLHLRDTALMEDNAAHQLHPVGAQSQHAVRRLPDGGERLRKNVVQRLPRLQTVFELLCFRLQLRVGHGFILFRHTFNPVHNGINGLQFAVTVASE